MSLTLTNEHAHRSNNNKDSNSNNNNNKSHNKSNKLALKYMSQWVLSTEVVEREGVRSRYKLLKKTEDDIYGSWPKAMCPLHVFYVHNYFKSAHKDSDRQTNTEVVEQRQLVPSDYNFKSLNQQIITLNQHSQRSQCTKKQTTITNTTHNKLAPKI